MASDVMIVLGKFGSVNPRSRGWRGSRFTSSGLRPAVARLAIHCVAIREIRVRSSRLGVLVVLSSGVFTPLFALLPSLCSFHGSPYSFPGSKAEKRR